MGLGVFVVGRGLGKPCGEESSVETKTRIVAKG
jgi:hypothetical protein